MVTQDQLTQEAFEAWGAFQDNPKDEAAGDRFFAAMEKAASQPQPRAVPPIMSASGSSTFTLGAHAGITTGTGALSTSVDDKKILANIHAGAPLFSGTSFYNAVQWSTATGEGAETVPSAIDREIAVVAGTYSPMRRVAKVVRTIGSYSQAVAQGAPSTSWVGELGTRSLTAVASFIKVQPPHGEVYAAAPLTAFLQDDSFSDISGFLTQEFGRAIGIAEGAAFANGTGTNQPKGVTAYTWAATPDASRAFGQLEYLASGVSAGGITLDKAIDLYYKLAPEYRAPGRCSWVMAPGALNVLRKDKNTSGPYYWEPSGQAGQPSTLLGCPVFEDPNLTVAASSLSIFVGDFSRGYTIMDVGTPRLIIDNVTQRGSTIAYLARRIGGGVVDSNAIKGLKLSVS